MGGSQTAYFPKLWDDQIRTVSCRHVKTTTRTVDRSDLKSTLNLNASNVRQEQNTNTPVRVYASRNEAVAPNRTVSIDRDTTMLTIHWCFHLARQCFERLYWKCCFPDGVGDSGASPATAEHCHTTLPQPPQSKIENLSQRKFMTTVQDVEG